MFAKSIRTRFLLWLAFLLVAILSGFGFTAFRFHTSNQLRNIDTELDRRLRSLSMDLRGGRPGGPFRGPGRGGRGGMGPEVDPAFPPPEFRKGLPPDRDTFRRGGPGDRDFRDGPPMFPPEIKLSARTSNLFDETDTNSFFYAIWTPGGVLHKQSTNAPTALEQPSREGRDTSTHIRMLGQIREAYHFSEMGHAILVGKSIANYLAESRRFALMLLGAGSAVLAIGLGGAWILTTRALQPIHNISAAATRISGGKLEERINVADTESELGQLATLLNSTFARLEAAFDQQKQFTGDAAHELRTPLTVIISEVQTTLARQRTAEEYRETLVTCLETAQSMRSLSQSLLELARLDSGQEAIQRETFDIAPVVTKCVELIRPLAKEKGIAIETSLEASAISADPVRIEQVITNLLSNAVFYNKENGRIQVTLKSEKGLAILKVVDTGQGINAEDLPHIFKRFYRADKSRSQASGKSGLGLAIAKAIIDAHGGSIEVQSVPGAGAAFTVCIPLAAA